MTLTSAIKPVPCGIHSSARASLTLNRSTQSACGPVSRQWTKGRVRAKERPAGDGGIFVAACSFSPPYRVAQRLVAMLAAILAAAILFTGCATAPAYKTLYAVGHTTDIAYNGYLDAVVAGQVRTNGVPRISRAYGVFQIHYGVALSLAQFDPKTPAPTNILARSAALIADVATEKKGGTQ